MTKIHFPQFGNREYSPFEMRQLVQALELRFQSLEAETESLFSTTDAGEDYALVGHTHSPSEIDGGVPSSIFDLSDVTGSPSLSDTLIWNGSAFEAAPPGAISLQLNDLTNVNATPTDGQVLTYDGVLGIWEASDVEVETGGGGSETLFDLTDTNIAAQNSGHLLYNVDGVNWEPTGAQFIFQSGVTSSLRFGEQFALNWLSVFDPQAGQFESTMLEFLPLEQDYGDGVGNIVANFEDTDGARTHTGDTRTWNFVGTDALNQIETTNPKFGSSSYAVGSKTGSPDNDAIYTDVSGEDADFTPGTRDWYIGFWFYYDNSMTGGNDFAAIGDLSSAARGIRWQINNGTISIAYDSTANGSEDTFPTFGSISGVDAWHYLEYERVGNNIYAYFDGLQSGNAFDCTGDNIGTSTSITARILSIGGSASSGAWGGTPAAGTLIDGFEIIVGANRHGGVAPQSTPTEAPAFNPQTFVVGDPFYRTQIDGTRTTITGNAFHEGNTVHQGTLDQQGNVISDINMVGGVLDITAQTGRSFITLDGDIGDATTPIVEVVNTGTNQDRRMFYWREEANQGFYFDLDFSLSNPNNAILFGTDIVGAVGEMLWMEQTGNFRFGGDRVEYNYANRTLDVPGAQLDLYDGVLDLGDKVVMYGVGDAAGAGAIGIESGSDIYARAQTIIRMYLTDIPDSGASNYWYLNSTTMGLERDVALYLTDSAGAPTHSLTLDWNSPDYDLAFTGTTDLNITGLTGEVFIDADLRTSGDLTVSGTTTTINSNVVSIADNIILLNSDETGAPTQNAGLEVERGTSLNVFMQYNETSDRWEFTNDGTAYVNILDSTADETITGLWNFIDVGTGKLTAYDIAIGDTTTPDYGIARIGDSILGRTSHTAADGAPTYNLNGAFIFQNPSGPVTGDIEFGFLDSAGLLRFGLPKSAVGNATYSPRSMIIAGPAIADSDVVTVSYWQGQGIFDNLVMDTGTSGADLGVQNDLEVEGDIFVDSIKESTTNAGITMSHDVDITGFLEIIQSDGLAKDYLHLRDSTDTQDFVIRYDGAWWEVRDEIAGIGTRWMKFDAGQLVSFDGNVDVGAGIDVTGNITVTGTVDGRDVALDGTNQDNHIADGTIHYAQSAISIPLSQINDVTATSAEVNLLDLAGLTAGWALVADTATTASWQQVDHTDLSNVGTNTHAQIDTHIGDTTVHYTKSSILLDDLGDVVETTITTGDLLRWNGTNWVNYADSNYATAGHTHLLAAGATDVTATASEVNLLDLAGLTAGWALIADTATTASWQAITESDISDLQSYLLNVVQDTTPQLGGNLDVQANVINTSTVNGNISLQPNGTGNVVLGNYTFDGDQTVGAGQDNYVLTYDDASGLVALEAASGGVSGTGVNNQIATWSGTDSIDGDPDLTWDGNRLTLGQGTNVIDMQLNASATSRAYIGTNTTTGTYTQILGRELTANDLKVGSTFFRLHLEGGGSPAVFTKGTFAIQNSAQTETAQYNTASGNHNIIFTSVTDMTLQGLTGDFWVRDGAGVKISDSSDLDFGIFSHDSTDFNTAFTNTVDWNITGLTGALRAGNYNLDVAQTVGAGQDNYVLTYDNATGLISLEAATGGSSSNSFETQTVTDTDSGFTWAETGSAVAASATDTLTWVSGTDIDIDVDAASDAIRIAFSNATGYTTNTGTVTSVGSGNGMDFTAITATGDVTLGTPSSITDTSTNSVTATSHTHDITQAAVTQYESNLTILESQITDGSLLARVGSAETITSTWTFNQDPRVSGLQGNDDTAGLTIFGGIAAGANIELYGGTHATLANRAFYDAVNHTFRDFDGTPTYMVVDSSGINVTGDIVVSGLVDGKDVAGHVDDTTIHFTQGSISIPLDQISDVTATAAEVNLLDLAGLTAGWVLSADTATTASWKAPSAGTTNLSWTASTRTVASDTGADAVITLFTSTDAGLAPLSGGGTTNFLRADGTWAAPAGGGNVSNTGTPLNNQLAIWTDATTIEGDADLTYDGTLLRHSSTATRYRMVDEGATADNGVWELRNDNEKFYIRALNDAATIEGQAITIDRTGTTIDDIQLLGTTTTVTGELHVTGNITEIEGASPRVNLFETGATVDEGKWRVMANGNNFYLDTLNDAESVAASLIEVTRTGTVGDQFRLRQGLNLEVYDPANTDYVTMYHDGSAGYLHTSVNHLYLRAAAGAANVNVWDGSSLYVLDGGSFRIYDSGDTDYANFAHDGTDFNTTFTNTTDWNISGLTGSVVFSDQVNFTQARAGSTPTFELNSTNPQFFFYETDAAVDEKCWDLGIAGGDLYLRTMTDARANNVDVLRIYNNAGTASSVQWTTDVLDVQGQLTSTGLFTASAGANVTGTMAATTVTGANVTTGADPGHTHTTASVSTTNWRNVDGFSYVDTLTQPTSLTVGNWYTIATNPAALDITVAPTGSGGSRSSGQFVVTELTSGRHETYYITAMCHYGQRPYLKVEGTHFGTQLFTQFRIVEAATYDGHALQVYANATQTTTWYVALLDNPQSGGWSLRNVGAQTPQASWATACTVASTVGFNVNYNGTELNFDSGGLTAAGNVSVGGYLQNDGAGYVDLRTDTATAGGMRVYNSANTLQGYLYHDNAQSFGLLHSSGGWAVKVQPAGTSVDISPNLNALNGIDVTGTVELGTSTVAGNIRVHDQGTITLFNDADGDTASIRHVGGALRVDSDVSSLELWSTSDIELRVDAGQNIEFTDTVGTGVWSWDTSSRLAFSQSLRLNDNKAMYFGTGADFNINFDGTNVQMSAAAAGTPNIEIRVNGSENAIVCNANSHVSMYYNNTEVARTDTAGGMKFGQVNDVAVDYVHVYHNGTIGIINSADDLVIQTAGTQRGSWSVHTDTGVTSALDVKKHDGVLYDVGFNQMPIFNDDVSDTLEASHCGSINIKDGTTARTLTLEASSSTDFPALGVTTVVNNAASGNYTITEGSGTTLYYIEAGVGLTDTAGGCTIGPGGVATIWRRSSSVYWIWGSEITP